ncbi:MAG: methyltransferase domain-containing protein [Holophagales bacterium]|nr:methyltransferase domain-containing protein [Holophagales bacterium]
MIRSIARLLAVPDKLAMLGLVRGMAAQMELMTVSALLRCGAMQHLQAPRTLDELSAATGTAEPEILRHLLDLGTRRRLLRCHGGRYSARSRLARSVASSPRGPIASMLQEVTTYHREVFDRLPDRLRGQPPHDYLDRYGELVARSSRLLEPWIRAFTAALVGGEKALRILEIGCGSGAYLRFYGELHEGHRGVGVDLDPGVVAAAQRLLADAGLEGRFSVRQGDVRDGRSWPEGPFDVVTAHQNVYYFDAEERAALWRRCREHLTDAGYLAILTPTSGGPLSDYFSLILLSTAGCYRLPSVDELGVELRAAGWELVRRERLIPGDAIWGIAARKAPATPG